MQRRSLIKAINGDVEDSYEAVDEDDIINLYEVVILHLLKGGLYEKQAKQVVIYLP